MCQNHKLNNSTRHKNINNSLSIFLVNIFSIVRFPNNPCQGTDSNGTCYSSEECSNRGGASVGSCANGYGVCCTCKLENTGHYISIYDKIDTEM